MAENLITTVGFVLFLAGMLGILGLCAYHAFRIAHTPTDDEE